MQKDKAAKQSKKKLVLRRESIKALDSLNLAFAGESNTNYTCEPSGNKPT